MFSVLAVPQQPTLRRWMTLFALASEAAMIAVAVVHPLIFPPTLPHPVRSTVVPEPSLSLAELPQRSDRRSTARVSSGFEHALVVRHGGFSFVHKPTGSENVEPGAPELGDIISSVDPGLQGGLIAGHPTLPQPAPQPRFRQSVLMEGNLIHRVEPEYPALAKQIRLEGVVVLKAVISPAGTVEKLELREGHPLLARAAIEAVRQWRYRPYYLNREPIEVETQITVKFTLSR